MARRSVNFTDTEEKYIKQQAVKNGVTFTRQVQSMLFSVPEKDQFTEFLQQQNEWNERIGNVLVQLVNQMKYANTIANFTLLKVRPEDGKETIEKVQKHVFGDDKEG